MTREFLQLLVVPAGDLTTSPEPHESGRAVAGAEPHGSAADANVKVTRPPWAWWHAAPPT